MDDVVDAVVDAVAGVLVGVDDDQPAVLERVGHRPRAGERRRRVAGGADHDDRAGAGAGDLDARVDRVGGKNVQKYVARRAGREARRRPR